MNIMCLHLHLWYIKQKTYTRRVRLVVGHRTVIFKAFFASSQKKAIRKVQYIIYKADKAIRIHYKIDAYVEKLLIRTELMACVVGTQSIVNDWMPSSCLF